MNNINNTQTWIIMAGYMYLAGFGPENMALWTPNEANALKFESNKNAQRLARQLGAEVR